MSIYWMKLSAEWTTEGLVCWLSSQVRTTLKWYKKSFHRPTSIHKIYICAYIVLKLTINNAGKLRFVVNSRRINSKQYCLSTQFRTIRNMTSTLILMLIRVKIASCSVGDTLSRMEAAGWMMYALALQTLLGRLEHFWKASGERYLLTVHKLPR